MSYKGQARPKKSGRPSKLDDVSTEAICEKLGGDKRIQINGPERQKLLEDEAKQTADRAQKPVAPLSRLNINYFEKKTRLSLTQTQKRRQTREIEPAATIENASPQLAHSRLKRKGL